MLQKLKQLPHNYLFVLVAGVYVWLVIEPCLIYHSFDAILPNAPPLYDFLTIRQLSLQKYGDFYRGLPDQV